MRARFAFFLMALGLTFGSHASQAGLVVTEIMFHPVTGTGQWVEIYNAGSTAIHPSDGIEFSFGGGPAMTVDETISAGEHVVFYQQVGPLFKEDSDFLATFPTTPSGTKLIGVEPLAFNAITGVTGNWSPFPTLGGLPFGLDLVEIFDTQNAESIDFIAGFSSFVSPIDAGQSIHLTDYQADNGTAGNWAASQQAFPTGVDPSVLSNELSFASPGFFPTSNAIPEPSSLAIVSTMMLLSATGRRRAGRR